MASPSTASPNPNLDKATKVREEGELSSSDDDDALPASSVAPSTCISDPPSSSIPNALVKTHMLGIKSGKSVSGHLPARSADIKSQTTGNCKDFNKKKVLLRSGNPGWCAPGGNRNLVISFSDDDDSCSDGEERSRNCRATAEQSLVVKGSQKPPALSNIKLDAARRTVSKEEKGGPKKVPLAHPSISSMTKMHGPNARGSGPSLTERRFWLRNPSAASRTLSNHDGGCSKNVNLSSSKLQDLRQQIASAPSRTLSNQDGGCSKNVNLSSSKLQDLRQQIAMRENELKLKMEQKNKENVSEPCRDVNVTGLSKDTPKKSSEVPSDIGNEDKEPDRKRLKIALDSSELPSSSGPGLKLAESMLVLKEPLFKDPIACQDGNMVDSSRRGLLPYSDGRPLFPSSQSGRTRVPQDAPSVAVSCSLASWVSRPMENSTMTKQTAALTNSTFADLPDKSASPDNTGSLHSVRRSRTAGCGDVDVNSLFENEELYDKELEEAQEHRRRCEIEEKNALKAYRRTQTALAEANAHCTYLYQRRELYSTQLRSLVMENPRLLWPSGQRRQFGDWNLNLSNTVADANLDLIPPSSHQMPTEFETANQLGYGSNVLSVDDDVRYRFSGNEDGHNLGSEACCEPDASSSDLLVRGNRSAANGIHSQSSDPNLSPDDDSETFPLDHKSIHANVTSPREEENSKESEKIMDVDSTTSFSADRSRDPIDLEAYLRSKLFSRLGMVGFSKQSVIGVNNESAAERVTEEDVTGAKSQMILDIVSPSDHKVLNGDNGGLREPEESISKVPPIIKTQKHVEHSLTDSPICAFDPDNGCFHFTNISSTSIIPFSSILRSAMRVAGPVSLGDMQITGQHCGSPDMCNGQNLLVQHDLDTLLLDTVNSAEEVAKCASFGKIDSYTCKSAIDPFWPLCMYELRGRCNNDECPWQHVKDYSSRNVNPHGGSDSADWQIESSSYNQTHRGHMEHSSVLTPPRYLVSLDGLKAGSQRCGSLQARQLVSSQNFFFSNSLAVSSSLLKYYPSDVPYLHGNDGCVESCGVSGHPLSFQSRKSTGNPLQNGSSNNDQSLEMALLVLDQEIDKVEGAKKALSRLSRALEADPVSLHLWVVYLLLFYSRKSLAVEHCKKSTAGKDDLFFCAVKHNEQSYELWLLYINSRRQLNDRFAAYERALSCLCSQQTNDGGHMMHKSAAILDLFLQMIYCFCMSGNVAKAVQRIYVLIPAERDSDESHSLLLSDILECLTISDKCIFWVCCVYLVIYRKLPDALVQQLEFEKDISAIEWPSVCLTLDEKQQVSELMKVAIDSVGLSTDDESLENSTLKPAHMIAVNHIKLMVAIDGEERYKIFLEKYRNFFPGCLELILLSARAHCCVDQSTNFEGFEEAIRVWPKEVPGIQCMWNQFTVYALESGRSDSAKEIMEKWFCSEWKPQFLHNQLTNSEKGDSQRSLEDFLSGSDLNSLTSSNKLDVVFGLLNLSLYSLLQNDVLGAHSALDKALSLANPEVLRHCIREHAVFLLNNGFHLRKDVSIHGLQDIVKAYMIYARAISTGDPLTRKFIKDIRKPRLRQLVSKVLSPVSPDSFLVNLVLDSWFGSSLLPHKYKELKDLVDFVEAILEVSPANYQLALSVCTLLCSDSVANNTKSASVLFWASSLLVNTIYHAVPVPPEHVWTEAANLLGKLTNVQEISESFHQRALSVYPFSINLWRSFLNLSTTPSKRSSVIEAARDKGLELD